MLLRQRIKSFPSRVDSVWETRTGGGLESMPAKEPRNLILQRNVAWDAGVTPVPADGNLQCIEMEARLLRRNPERFPVEGVSRRVARTRRQPRRACAESTRALMAAVDAKDPYMRNHSRTVAAYAEAIGRSMRLDASLLEALRAASLLHDIGKIAVPDAILIKPGPLTREEFDTVKKHPETAFNILGHLSSLADQRPMILHHHERYDGEGYPAGLAKGHIPVGARVLAVADALDAMLSSRSYKPAYSLDQARTELIAGAGWQFDPAVTEATLQWLKEAREMGGAAHVPGST